MRVQGLVVAVLVRVVQGGFLSVLLRVGGETVGCVAVVSGLFVVPFFEVLHGGAVVLHRVLEVVGGLLVGLNDFLVFFGMVSHRREGKSGNEVVRVKKKGSVEPERSLQERISNWETAARQPCPVAETRESPRKRPA